MTDATSDPDAQPVPRLRALTSIDRLREELEVDIESWRGENVGPRRTTIWLVVVDGLPYVRSIFGDRGRWFADLRLEPHGAVHVGGTASPRSRRARRRR